LITIQHLYKSFGRFKALDDISVQFDRGQAVSLLGPNGSGKTTIIKSILGLVIPEKGKITINGITVSDHCAYRSQIGYMPQIGRYPDNMTINQVIKMLKEIRTDCVSYDEDLISGLGIDKVTDKMMKSLSGGTRQKVSACLAFLFNPEILILDEPTAGLDPVSSEILKAKIASARENGKVILITSHVLSDLEDITSDLIYLQDGKLVFYKKLSDLRSETGEEKLNKIVASILQKKPLGVSQA
jgi:Cu-processing system ATP-binding protein